MELDSAWRQVLSDAWSDDLPDILRLNDYKLTWEKWKVELRQQLEIGSYKPSPPRLIEMPKDGLLVRPLCLIRDRVVYWAIVNRLAPGLRLTF